MTRVAGDVGPLGVAAAIVNVHDVLVAEMLLLAAVNDEGHVPAGGADGT